MTGLKTSGACARYIYIGIFFIVMLGLPRGDNNPGAQEIVEILQVV